MSNPPTPDEVLTAIQRLIDAHGFSPSYPELAKEFRVSVATIHAKVRILRDSGLVNNRRGKRCLIPNTPRSQLEGKLGVFFQELRSGETPDAAADAAELHLETGRLLARELKDLGG